VYLRARMYAPDSGLFVSKDTAAGFSRRPLTQHPWLYALANPLRYIDPSGRQVAAPQCEPDEFCFTGTAGGQIVTIHVFTPGIPEPPEPPEPPHWEAYIPPSPLLPGDCRPNDDFWDILRYIKRGTGSIETTSNRQEVEQPVPCMIGNIPAKCSCSVEEEYDTTGDVSVNGECRVIFGVQGLADVGGKLQLIEEWEGGVFVEIGGQTLELALDKSGPFFELELLGLHLKTRAPVYRFVLGAQRTVMAFGTTYVGIQTWRSSFEYDTMVNEKFTRRDHYVFPGEDPGIALWVFTQRYPGLPIKMFPEGQFDAQ